MSYRKRHTHSKIKSLKPKKSIIKRPVFWIFLLFFILISTVSYFVFFFQGFNVANIEVSGNSVIKSEELENIIQSNLTGALGIPSKNIIIISLERIRRKIIDNFPVIETLEIQKELPNKIKLTVKERNSFAVLCDSNNISMCFLVDENGVIFEEAQPLTNDKIILFKDLSEEETKLGNAVLPKNSIELIAKVGKNLENNFQLGITKVLVSNPLIITTSENWDIYFDPERDTDFQVAKLKTLLEDEITENTRKNLQYIYLQYGDKAYYK